MNEPVQVHDTARNEFQTSKTITVTAIVSCVVLVLACIVAFTVIVTAFFLNAPW